MNERFDEERYMEVQLRLREIYSAMVMDSRGEEPARDEASFDEFKEGLKHDPAQAPSRREVADARRIKKEHRAALRKYERAHHKRYPQLDVASARSFWDELLADVNYIALLNEDNPDYGALLELRYVLHDAVEPARLYRRLPMLRGWSHGKAKQVLGRGPRQSGSAGDGERG
jgi:hypothetical protein